jgi:transposase
VKHSTLRYWLKQAEEADRERPGRDRDLVAENRRLRAENHQLRLEREILKKATAFFAKHSK